MRAYVITTGVLFGLLVVVHIWRVVVEGVGVARDPWFILVTVAGAGLSVWAWRVLRVGPRG